MRRSPRPASAVTAQTGRRADTTRTWRPSASPSTCAAWTATPGASSSTASSAPTEPSSIRKVVDNNFQSLYCFLFQQNFVCEYWFNVDCASSESFYSLNDNIGEVPEGSLSSSASSPAASNSYESPSVAASSPVGYSAPSEPSYQPPPPQPEYSAARTGRQRSGKAASRPDPNPRQSSSNRLAKNPRPRTQNQSPRRGKSKEVSNRNPNKRPTPSNNNNSINNRLNEVNVNRRRPKNNRPNSQSRKVTDFNRSQVKSQSKLIPPSPAQRNPESRRSKKLRNNNEGRRGRQEAVATGYLPPLDQSFDNSLANYDEYEYEEAPLPTYSSNAADPAPADTGYGAPETSYGAPASDPPSSYGAPASDPPSSYGAPASDPPSSYGAPEISYNAPEPANTGYGAPETSYSVPDVASYDEVASDIAEVVYQEDELPTYNSGVYSPGTGGGADSGPGGERYAAPLAPAIPADSAINQVDVLPSYNNGVYNGGSDSASSGGDRYAAPLAPAIPADSAINQEDVLPSYNNGVYTGGSSNGPGGGNYVAPASDTASSSYSGPQDSGPTFSDSYGSPSSAPASLYEEPVPGSYQDPEADILPEYHKSEISLGLNNRNEVPRIEPFSNDYAEPLYIGTYTASGSNVRPEVVEAPPPPDTGYGVPAGPTLSDYNIQEVSDKGFKSSRSSSYGR